MTFYLYLSTQTHTPLGRKSCVENSINCSPATAAGPRLIGHLLLILHSRSSNGGDDASLSAGCLRSLPGSGRQRWPAGVQPASIHPAAPQPASGLCSSSRGLQTGPSRRPPISCLSGQRRGSCRSLFPTHPYCLSSSPSQPFEPPDPAVGPPLLSPLQSIQSVYLHPLCCCGSVRSSDLFLPVRNTRTLPSIAPLFPGQ